jgi:hypothetical protein
MTPTDHAFIDRLKTLSFVDRMDWMTDRQWERFSVNPANFLIRATAAQQADILAAAQPRAVAVTSKHVPSRPASQTEYHLTNGDQRG